MFNWKTELARFDGKMKVVEIYGPEATRSKLISSIKENEKAIYITSYDSLRLDVDNTGMQQDHWGHPILHLSGIFHPRKKWSSPFFL